MGDKSWSDDWACTGSHIGEGYWRYSASTIGDLPPTIPIIDTTNKKLRKRVKILEQRVSDLEDVLEIVLGRLQETK